VGSERVALTSGKAGSEQRRAFTFLRKSKVEVRSSTVKEKG
jgi:hypothetical protein